MQIRKFVLLLMSKFIPVRALKNVELVDVNYRDRGGQLEGKYIYFYYGLTCMCVHVVCVFVSM